MKASIANLTYLYPDDAFKIQCCSTIIGIIKKGERQARLRIHLQLATETAGHITPLSPWRGAGGEAGLGKAFYFITL